jgi:hypothetical protein
MAVNDGQGLSRNQEVQEISADGRRSMGLAGSIPYLSSPASGSPLGAALRAHAARK